MIARMLAAFAAAVLLPAVQGHAQTCGGLAGAQTVESAGYVLAYRTDPPKLEIGRHFGIDIAICPKAGTAPPEQLRVDGYMPEHRHGMNYKAVVRTAGDGVWRADGLMFHMPGRWDFIFELSRGGKSERLTHGILLQ